ncbi:MAG: 50S ribosomal protein L23 [Elusimicrobiota bacterium]
MSTKISSYDILLGPVITEKSTNMKTDSNKFVFYVDCRANKTDIKKAVEEVFKVTVLSINTLAVHGKPRRMGRFAGMTPKRKKAVVTLKEGDRVKLMEGP